jgi:uncharacterized protein
MVTASREFQIFAKPGGPICNLDCAYCYYLKKEDLYRNGEPFRMTDDTLEEYIVQHIEASPGPVINFSWHGGEPTTLGLDYFRKIVRLQHKHLPPGRRVTNGIQTNGTLLDEDWSRFLAAERFSVGISLDGPQELHDRYRVSKGRKPTYEQAMRGYKLLQLYHIPHDILCVVHAQNVKQPAQVYRFFKKIQATHIGFLPLVERQSDALSGATDRSVPAEAWGVFLGTIFDEWLQTDIGRVYVRIFEEVAGTALGHDYTLCILRKTCGDIPVVEHNGDFFPCDHFVETSHCSGNIRERRLVELLESPEQTAFGRAKFDSLPAYCHACEVLTMCNGGCPKDRFIRTPDGQSGLNYLCAGYRRFFNHCRPFVAQLAALPRQSLDRQPPQHTVESVPERIKTGRNDPCPCGSGRKFKKCCGGK